MDLDVVPLPPPLSSSSPSPVPMTLDAEIVKLFRVSRADAAALIKAMTDAGAVSVQQLGKLRALDSAHDGRVLFDRLLAAAVKDKRGCQPATAQPPSASSTADTSSSFAGLAVPSKKARRRKSATKKNAWKKKHRPVSPAVAPSVQRTVIVYHADFLNDGDNAHVRGAAPAGGLARHLDRNKLMSATAGDAHTVSVRLSEAFTSKVDTRLRRTAASRGHNCKVERIDDRYAEPLPTLGPDGKWRVLDAAAARQARRLLQRDVCAVPRASVCAASAHVWRAAARRAELQVADRGTPSVRRTPGAAQQRP